MDEYQELAIAIVSQAAKDYRAALRGMKRYPAMKSIKKRAEKLEEFFRSDWYHQLTEADSE